MSEQQAAGHKKGDPMGMTPVQAFQAVWAGAAIGAAPVALILRTNCGYRFWRGWYLLGTGLPMLTASMRPRDPWLDRGTTDDDVCLVASLCLVALFAYRWVSSQKNRRVEHSLFWGRTVFFAKVRPGVEFVLALGLAWLMSFLSEPLATAFTLSASCNLVNTGLTMAKDRVTDERGFDDEAEGLISAERRRAFRDR